MEEYRWNYHVPEFGRWDYEDDNMAYTQYFETARTRPNFTSFANHAQDTDLYVTGDLYQNDVVTPAVILVPRRSQRKGNSRYPNVNGVKKQQEIKQKQEWGGYSYDIKEPPSPIISPPKPSTYNSKPIDEDLYKIPPEYLHVKSKRKKRLGLFSSCLLPACA